MTPQVIGISGITGAGKTTLAQALAKDLQATSIGWDDFDEISTGPEDYVEWYERGQNYTEWDYPALADTLKTLKSNCSLSHPTLGHVLTPTEYIIFDALLGRLHSQTGCLIDRSIHITLPLDVSLARRVLRDFKNADKTKAELLEELEFYLFHSRKLFFDDDLMQTADFILDGMLSGEAQLQEVKTYLQRKK